jgi:hypothetical protein
MQQMRSEAGAGNEDPSATPSIGLPANGLGLDRGATPGALQPLDNTTHGVLSLEAAARDAITGSRPVELVSVKLPAPTAANRRASTATSRAVEFRGSATRSPRSTASRVAPAHQPSVEPRRGTKVDPDGTFEPYL